MKRTLGLLIVCVALLATSSRAQTYVNLGINQPISLGADAGIDTTICQGDSLVLGGAPTALNGTSPYTYSWSTGMHINDTTVANPVFAGDSLGTFQYVVSISDTNNCTAYDTITVVVEVCAGMDEATAGAFSVYPNPTKDRFNIVFGNIAHSKAVVEVLSVTGQQVMNRTINSPANKTVQFDLAGYAKGMYSIKTTLDGKQVVTKQIIVQ